MRNLLLSLTLVLCANLAFAQNGFYSGQGLAVNPFSPGTGSVPSVTFLSNAQVRVCTYPTLLASPCTPLATVSDIFGNILTVPPGGFGQVPTDAVGRYNFQALPGTYLIQGQASSSNTPSFSAIISIPPLSLSAGAIINGNNNFTGINTFGTIAGYNNRVVADGFVGADCGAKIMAADASLSTNPGIIEFTQRGCGNTISTPVTLSTGHWLLWSQGSGPSTPLAVNALITMPFDSNQLLGCGHRNCVMTNTSLSTCSILVHGDSGSVFGGGQVSGITIDGTGNPNSGACGLQFSQIINFKIDDVVIQNFSASGQVGMLTPNGNTFGSVEWTERTVMDRVWLNNNKIGWNVTSNGDLSAASIGYSKIKNMEINMGAGQIGVQTANNIRLYSSDINIKINDTVGQAQTANFNLLGTTSWDHNTYMVASEGGTGNGLQTGTTAIINGCGQFDMGGLNNVYGGTLATGTVTSTFRITPFCPTQSLGISGANGMGSFYPIADGGQLSACGGASQTCNITPLLQDGSSPLSYYGFLGGNNVGSPFVAMYGSFNNAFEIYKTTAGSPPSSMVEVDRIDNAGNEFLTGNISLAGHLTQSATNRYAGSCAMSAGTSCTFSLGASYNTPLCIVTVQSATLTGGVAGCTVSGTTVTITSASPNSLTWAALIVGNPN